MHDDNYRIGSTKHSRLLSDSMILIPDGMTMGPTDTALCVKALRSYASRWRRRAALAVVLAIVVALGAGVPDVNRDGRVSFADLGVVAPPHNASIKE